MKELLSSFPPREERLQAINEILKEAELPPWELTNIGDLEQGRFEILTLTNYEEVSKGRVRIEFDVMMPNGMQTKIWMNFGGRLIYVVPILSTGSKYSIFLLKRSRLEKGKWSYEIPHSLVLDHEAEDDRDMVKSPSHAVLRKVFGTNFTDRIGAAGIFPIRKFVVKGEANPAESFAFIANVNLKGASFEETVEKDGKAVTVVHHPELRFKRVDGEGDFVRLAPWQAYRLIEKGEINDAYTIAVLSQATTFTRPHERTDPETPVAEEVIEPEVNTQLKVLQEAQQAAQEEIATLRKQATDDLMELEQEHVSQIDKLTSALTSAQDQLVQTQHELEQAQQRPASDRGGTEELSQTLAKMKDQLALAESERDDYLRRGVEIDIERINLRKEVEALKTKLSDQTPKHEGGPGTPLVLPEP